MCTDSGKNGCCWYTLVRRCAQIRWDDDLRGTYASLNRGYTVIEVLAPFFYDLYHDESKELGLWHGMLLVPRPARADLLHHLELVRINTRFTHPVTLKKLKDTGERFCCIRGWINIGVQSLIQNPKRQPIPVETGEQNKWAQFTYLKQPIKARFILFRVRDGHQDMQKFSDDAAKVETTCRMGLKGGLHLFARGGESITLGSLHFDGYEHYHRHIDSNRILGRLIPTLREGIEIKRPFVIDDRSSDHRLENAQEYDNCQLLQLTDLLVSGFRTVLGDAKNDVQRNVAAPLKELSAKFRCGPQRMRNSRWFGGFCISECWLANDEWQFGDIEPDLPDEQMNLALTDGHYE